FFLGLTPTDPEACDVLAHLPERAVAEAPAENNLPLIVRQGEVVHGHEHLVTHVEGAGSDSTQGREDDMVLGHGEVAPTSRAALDLELQEALRATIVEPVDDSPGLD